MEENKDLNIEAGEAVDKASFADVNYGEDKNVSEEKSAEKSAEKKEKKQGKGVFGWIAVAVLVIVLLAAAFMLIKTKGGSDEGLANRFGVVIGIPDGDYLYHTDYYGDKIYKTGLTEGNTSNSELIAEDVAPFGFTEYEGKIYFFDRIKNGIYKMNKTGEVELIYDGVTYYHQFCGKYIYYLDPVASYGGFVKRIPVTGGEAETVLNVYTTCFAVSGKNIVYYDSAINDVLFTTLDNALENAKASEEALTSADIKAIVVAEDRFAQNLNVVGDSVFFTDGSKENVICRASIKTGEVEEVNFGTTGTFLNVCGDYMFYVGADNALYRMNLDGKDIRNLTGNAFKEFAGFGLFKDTIVAYALMPQLNSETMQTEQLPVIVVMDFEGKPKNVMPAADTTLSNMYPTEMPEVTEEAEVTEEVPAETSEIAG